MVTRQVYGKVFSMDLVTYPTDSRKPRHAQSVVAFCVGALGGLITFDAGSAFLLAVVGLGVGGTLGWLFRADPGALTREWHRVRARRNPFLYRVYAVSGPWLCWSGAGAVGGLVARLVVWG